MVAAAETMAVEDSTGEKALDIRNLEKRFGEVEVLREISVDLEPGGFLVLVGPSGCGKSTLLNCIAGLEEVTSGAVIIGGRDVTSLPPRDRDIAMVFQSYALYPTMTVAENIAFGMKVRRIPQAEQGQKTQEVAKLLQIDHLLDRKPSQLSGGQRQRVAMGRALVRDPKLFLFDEPLSNLDAKLRVEMRTEIKKLHERLHASIVYVTHDQIEAMTLGTRIVVLKGGIVQQFGSPAEIYGRPANMFVADFMGSPPMNLIEANCSAAGDGMHLRLAEHGDEAEFIDSNPPAGLKAYAGKKVVVGIRPETVSLTSAANAELSLPSSVIEHTGSDTFVTLETRSGTMIVRLPPRSEVKAGQNVPLKLDHSTISYFDPGTEKRIV